MTAQDRIDELHARAAEYVAEDVLRPRLTDMLASCQIIDGQIQRGAVPDERAYESIGIIEGYVDAWKAGLSRKEAWGIEDA